MIENNLYSNFYFTTVVILNIWQAWINSEDPDQMQSDQSLHYLLFGLRFFDTLLYGKPVMFKVRIVTAILFGCWNFFVFLQ